MARLKYIFPDRATAEVAYRSADDRATLISWALQDLANVLMDDLASATTDEGMTYELRLSRSHHPHGGIVTVFAYDEIRLACDQYNILTNGRGGTRNGLRFVEVRYLSDDFAHYPLEVREALGTLRAVGHRLMVERHAANRAVQS
jgi:hypothetical protein